MDEVLAIVLVIKTEDGLVILDSDELGISSTGVDFLDVWQSYGQAVCALHEELMAVDKEELRGAAIKTRQIMEDLPLDADRKDGTRIQ